MSLIIPDAIEVETLTNMTASLLRIKLFSNNYTPIHTSTSASFTELTGGGYVAKDLLTASWTITAGEPSKAVYASQTWLFTGPTDTPGTVYGYYIIRVSDNKLVAAERFPSGSLPFSPANGSKIVIQPRLTAQSEF